MNSMTFPVSGSGGDSKKLEPGTYTAVCDRVILMGYQPGSAQYPKPKLKVYIRWQIPDERTDDNMPMVIGSTFTASMNEKAELRKILTGWRGANFSDDEAQSFDVSKLVGQPCMISVVSKSANGKTYTNVASVSRLSKSTKPPKVEGEPLVYWNTKSNEDAYVFKKLPEWLQKKIEDQIDVSTQSTGDDNRAPPPDDDIPF